MKDREPVAVGPSVSELELILEAVLFAASEPVPVKDLLAACSTPDSSTPARAELDAALERLTGHYRDRSIELVRSAGGYRFRVRQRFSAQVQAAQPERPPRLSRALLETLAIIAYRQPVTRAEIEDIRGVAWWATRKIRNQIASPEMPALRLGKFEMDWLFLRLPALLRRLWLCSIVTELPAWPTRVLSDGDGSGVLVGLWAGLGCGRSCIRDEQERMRAWMLSHGIGTGCAVGSSSSRLSYAPPSGSSRQRLKGTKLLSHGYSTSSLTMGESRPRMTKPPHRMPALRHCARLTRWRIRRRHGRGCTSSLTRLPGRVFLM
jgi:hypothetical protein